MTRWKALAAATASIMAMAVPVIAQAPADAPAPQPAAPQSWNGLPDRFQVMVGLRSMV